MNFARLGYVTFSTTQNHYEDPAIGVSHQTLMVWNNIQTDNFPTIQKLYAANGCGERIFCKYFHTEHSYDRTKREYTYWWMERWLRNQTAESPAAEPETQTFPVETILKLSADVSGDKGFPEISRIYRAARGYQKPELASADNVRVYRKRMTDSLRDLLGEDAILPRQATRVAGEARAEGDLAVQRAAYPSEAKVLVPTVLLMPATRSGKLPITIVLAGDGKEALLAQTGPQSPRELARQGNLVVLPDVRTYGELFSTGGQNAAGQRQAWERNGIVWGRPVPGMAATDLRAVLDGVAVRPEADGSRVTVLVRSSGDLSIAALFAMTLDARITAADLDFGGACFENHKLPLVSCVLQHGDVLQWAAAVADRRLTLRGIPPEAGDAAWLQRAFAAAGNADGLTLP